MSSNVIGIARLVNYLKRSIDNDINLKTLMVSGEISNFTNHKSGHFYFSLKDDKAKMNCVMFKTNTASVNISIKDGMKVIVTCSVSMYEPQGTLQLYVTKIQSDGIGDLYLMFEELKKKLHAEHLFDEYHKKALPEYPLDIAIVSAKTGAALQDVHSIISRRWPLCRLTLYPSLVQGQNAAKALIDTLHIADKNNHDLILLVRGGGSIEDLWCFNDEALARTIYDLESVIVSGVGHETDTTLVDYVSDARAATPSAAAELVTPNMSDVHYKLQTKQKAMTFQLKQLLKAQRLQLDQHKSHPAFTNPEYLLKDLKTQLMMNINRLSLHEVYFQKKQFELQNYRDQLQLTIREVLNRNKTAFANKITLLDAYGPLNILKRGYSIASKNEKIIQSVKEVNKDDALSLRLSDGSIQVKVTGGE